MRHPQVCAVGSGLLLCLAGSAAAEGHRLAGDTLRAFQQLDEATEQLARARAALAALDAGEAPRGRAQDWAGAPAALAAAAEALKRSAGPLLPDVEEQLVSVRQLKSCATRAEAMARLERQHRALQAGAQRGAETRAALRDRLGAAQAAEETRRFLLKGAAKHAGEAPLAEAFTWRWADLEGPAAAALAGYTGELRRYLERVDRNAAEHRARGAEAADLLAAWGRARDCMLAGSWSGTRTLAGAVSGLSLQLSSTGEAWTGSANLDGVNVPVKGVTLSGSAVTIGLSDGKGSLSGTLAPDGRGFKGNHSSSEGLAAVQLRRQ